MDPDRAHGHHSPNAPVITTSHSIEPSQTHDDLSHGSDQNEERGSPPNVTPPSHFMLRMPETAEEVKQRRQAIRDRIQALRDSLQTSTEQESNPDCIQRDLARGNAFNGSGKPLDRHMRTAASSTEVEQFTSPPQPPTPPRRRPPLTSVQSGASGCGRLTQVRFGDRGQVRDGKSRGNSPGTQLRSQIGDQSDRPSVLPPDIARLEGGSPVSPSPARTESDSSDRDSKNLHRQQALYRLGGNEQLSSGEPVGDGCAILPSAVQNPYTLGNHQAGFNSGRYVTTLEQPEQKKPKEKEAYMKRVKRFLRRGRK